MKYVITVLKYTLSGGNLTALNWEAIGKIYNLREKFSPGPEFEPGSPALWTGALTTWATQTIDWAKLDFFSY